jgi:hypothetical protein
MNHSLKPLLYIVLGGLCLSLVSFIIWVSVNGSHQNIIFGRVTDVSATSITVANKQNDLTTIVVEASTAVTNRRDEILISNIPINSFVQITSIEDEDEPTAQSIWKVPQN